MDPDDVAGFFDSEAARYDAAYDEAGPEGYALRSRLAAVLRLLGAGPGDVLDAGMGPGRLCTELDRRGWTVSGVDSSKQMVAFARTRLPHARDRLLPARLESLPFADASFDAVVATGVLEYLDDRAAGLAELGRVLRPGGTAVVSVPNAHGIYSLWCRHIVYPASRAVKRHVDFGRRVPPRRGRVRSRPRLEAMLGGTGLHVVAVEYVSLLVLLTPLDRLFPRTTVWVAQRFEGRGSQTGKLLATQLVVAARKEAASLS
jgi:ubiquinone/menaquinone biosynthesis C-methylase UbiE